MTFRAERRMYRDYPIPLSVAERRFLRFKARLLGLTAGQLAKADYKRMHDDPVILARPFDQFMALQSAYERR
jgi:hypothetical protein